MNSNVYLDTEETIKCYMLVHTNIVCLAPFHRGSLLINVTSFETTMILGRFR